MNTKPLAELIYGRGFDQFQQGLAARFRAYRLDYKLAYCKPTDNTAMCLDFESPIHLGRITAWESGECDIEVLEAASGETVLFEHHQASNEGEFHELLAKLVVFMRDAMGWPNN
jgi:hypothetical protein